eukprot:TRINITY_DN11928_c0_g1_i2.p1 TRINITY_DN11928_c0_g1~~TRINITY_DN11928_c0_g1_i2.p1  ORF type:complete len:227 (+),score=75.42 TRINITY_DN11928_c0_g1_i2:581-1261(+)
MYSAITPKNSELLKKTRERESLAREGRIKRLAQERLDWSQKRCSNRQEVVSKNKETAKKIKEIINKGLENAKKVQEQKLAVMKARQAREKAEKSIVQDIMTQKSKNAYLERKLQEELEKTQENVRLIKKLKEQEIELMADLQTTINTSMDMIEQAKDTPYLSKYHDKLSRRVKTSMNNTKVGTITLELNEDQRICFFYLNKHSLSLIHICRCRRYAVCRSRWSPYH